jgi:PadR family transcriptional regulator, regulatory protein PadR
MASLIRANESTLQVLAILLDAPSQWHYGYGLSQQTGLKSGTLYPILMRLHDRGLLATKWEESPERGRPPRHLYKLTAEGARAGKEAMHAKPVRSGATLRPACEGRAK